MNRNRKYLISIFILALLSLTVLLYVFDFKLIKNLDSRFSSQAKDVLEAQDSLTPEEAIARLPQDLSASCRGWLSQALLETADEARGRLIYLLPRIAQSANANVTEKGEERDVTGVCDSVSDNLNLAALDANLDRVLLQFKDSDTGNLALSVQQLKAECNDEIEDRRLTSAVYQVWQQMHPGHDINPCE